MPAVVLPVHQTVSFLLVTKTTSPTSSESCSGEFGQYFLTTVAGRGAVEFLLDGGSFGLFSILTIAGAGLARVLGESAVGLALRFVIFRDAVRRGTAGRGTGIGVVCETVGDGGAGAALSGRSACSGDFGGASTALLRAGD